MNRTLVIKVDLSDESDFDWVGNKVVSAVEDALDEAFVENRHGDAMVYWEEEQ